MQYIQRGNCLIPMCPTTHMQCVPHTQTHVRMPTSQLGGWQRAWLWCLRARCQTQHGIRRRHGPPPSPEVVLDHAHRAQSCSPEPRRSGWCDCRERLGKCSPVLLFARPVLFPREIGQALRALLSGWHRGGRPGNGHRWCAGTASSRRWRHSLSAGETGGAVSPGQAARLLRLAGRTGCGRGLRVVGQPCLAVQQPQPLLPRLPRAAQQECHTHPHQDQYHSGEEDGDGGVEEGREGPRAGQGAGGGREWL